MADLYRVGRHQPQNVYRGEQYIGVMFSPEDAALVVQVLNTAVMPRRCSDCPRSARELKPWVEDGQTVAWLGPTCWRRRVERAERAVAMPLGGGS